ncbi:MAG: phosphonate C-P lyase system protein PhnH [Alphaproteobacteria bacterium]|nr:phosphonate C-P lyase system protein PhnH [Alphaproteobacteria bacterium]
MTPLDLSDVGAGFRDPVADAQRCFRLVLDATAHPGRIVELPADLLAGNESGLPDAAAVLALTLLDFETPVWLDAVCRPATAYLRFHCGMAVVDDPKESRFAFAGDRAALPPLDSFDLGSTEFPDRSTTLVVGVPGLAADSGAVLRGPGLKGTARLRADGIGAEFWRARAKLAPLFPLGIDLVFVCGRRLAAVPRTTIVDVT